MSRLFLTRVMALTLAMVVYPPLLQARPLTSDQKQADFYLAEGVEHASHRQYQAAIQSFDRALKLDKSLTEAYYNRALSNYILDRFEAAIADYTNAIKLDPEYADAYYNRGLAYQARADITAARADWQRAQSLYEKQGSRSGYRRATEALNRV